MLFESSDVCQILQGSSKSGETGLQHAGMPKSKSTKYSVRPDVSPCSFSNGLPCIFKIGICWSSGFTFDELRGTIGQLVRKDGEEKLRGLGNGMTKVRTC